MKPLRIKGLAFQDGSLHCCGTLTSRTMPEFFEDLRTLNPSLFDLLEWRADYLDPGEIPMADAIGKGLLAIGQEFPEMPLIFTFRRTEEGGQSDLSPQEILTLQKAAGESGLVDLLDVELALLEPDSPLSGAYAELLEKLKMTEVKLLLSWHDFQETPPVEYLCARFQEARMRGAHMAKIAVKANTREEAERLLTASARCAEMLDIPHIALAMGEEGAYTRYARGRSQSCITFAPVTSASAPGQLDAETLREKLGVVPT